MANCRCIGRHGRGTRPSTAVKIAVRDGSPANYLGGSSLKTTLVPAICVDWARTLPPSAGAHGSRVGRPRESPLPAGRPRLGPCWPLQRAALAGSGAIYSMTRSASSSNEFGICMPICCAACILITNAPPLSVKMADFCGCDRCYRSPFIDRLERACARALWVYCPVTSVTKCPIDGR